MESAEQEVLIREVMLGERLRNHIEQLIARYSARLRNDPLIPMAKALPAPLVEDHAMSFFSDVFQTLVVLEKADDLKGREESDLLVDGSQIQHLVAQLHGRQRHRLGWTESALEREYQIINEEVASLVKHRAADADGAERLDWALGTLNRLLGVAHEASLDAFHAAETEARN